MVKKNSKLFDDEAKEVKEVGVTNNDDLFGRESDEELDSNGYKKDGFVVSDEEQEKQSTANELITPRSNKVKRSTTSPDKKKKLKRTKKELSPKKEKNLSPIKEKEKM